MKIKVVKQLDGSVTLEFYNSKNKKIDYEIDDIEKDGLGFIYTINDFYISRINKRRKG